VSGSPRNKFEKKIYQQLKKAKVKFGYETERITYLLSGYYLPDFVIETPYGRVYIETKGYLRPEHKRKMCAVKKLHPEIDLRILFYSHNKKYIKWAEKNGFRYAVDTIPKEWLDGL
jgi:predicted nuclease of restriction endonuclease-like RecB superfamily